MNVEVEVGEDVKVLGSPTSTLTPTLFSSPLTSLSTNSALRVLRLKLIILSRHNIINLSYMFYVAYFQVSYTKT